jgi:hypothetical protein
MIAEGWYVTNESYTTTEAAQFFPGVRAWQIRKAADALGDQIPRFGPYRLIPAGMLSAIEAELRRRGYLQAEVVNAK